jgi:hypothetical protein
MSRAHQKLPDPPRVHTGQSKKTRRQSNPQIGNTNNNNNNSNNNKTVSSNTQLNNSSNTGAATRTRSRQFQQFFKSVFAKPDPRSESPGTKTNNQSFCNNKIHSIMFYVEFMRKTSPNQINEMNSKEQNFCYRKYMVKTKLKIIYFDYSFQIIMKLTGMQVG